MGRHKKQIPEVPVIDYKKQIADQCAKDIVSKTVVHNLASFIQTSYEFVFNNCLELDQDDRYRAIEVIMQLLRGVIVPCASGWTAKTKIDWISDYIQGWYEGIGYEDYEKGAKIIQQYFADDMKENVYCAGSLNDMHTGLKLFSTIREALKKIHELVPAVNPNGKLIEVPQ